MSKSSCLLLASLLAVSSISARATWGSPTSDRCYPAPRPGPWQDANQDTPGSAVYDVGIDLHLLATLFENCRPDPDCAEGLKGFFRDRFDIVIQDLPDPWSGNSDRTDETDELLSIAAELWDYVEEMIGARLERTEEIHSTSTRLFFLAKKEDAEAISREVDRVRQSIIASISDDNVQPGLSKPSSEASRARLVDYVERAFNLYAAPGIRTPVPLVGPAPQRDPEPSRAQARFDDPLLWAQWGLERTGILETWDDEQMGYRPIRIALLDSGIDPDQRDLDSSDWFASRFCDDRVEPDCDEEDTSDPAGHGTALAGILAATMDNGYRVAGIYPDADLLNLRVLDLMADGTVRGSIVDAVRALEVAGDRCSVVAVLAWGQRAYSPALWEAILRARAADVLVVTGAGNDQLDLGGPRPFFPASFRAPEYCQPDCPCLDNLIAVGATKLAREDDGTWVDKKASFSNRGKEVVDLGAPGVGIVTLWRSDRFGGVIDASGTSAATAMVAGAAALVAETLPSSPPPTDRFFTIRSRLLRGADRVEHLCDHFAEGRRLNVYNAVNDISMEDLCICTSAFTKILITP